MKSISNKLFDSTKDYCEMRQTHLCFHYLTVSHPTERKILWLIPIHIRPDEMSYVGNYRWVVGTESDEVLFEWLTTDEPIEYL